MNHIAPADLSNAANWLFWNECTWEGNCIPLYQHFTACLLVQHTDFLTWSGKKLPDSINCLPMVTTGLRKGWWTQGLGEGWVGVRKKQECLGRSGGQRCLIRYIDPWEAVLIVFVRFLLFAVAKIRSTHWAEGNFSKSYKLCLGRAITLLGPHCIP